MQVFCRRFSKLRGCTPTNGRGAGWPLTINMIPLLSAGKTNWRFIIPVGFFIDCQVPDLRIRRSAPFFAVDSFELSATTVV